MKLLRFFLIIEFFIPIFLFTMTLHGQQEGWMLQSSSTNKNLYGVSFSNPNTCIAVGEEGTILRSTDSGINWKIISSPFTDALRSISFLGNVGLAVGISGRIIRSTDAGENWSDVNSPTTKDLYSVSIDNRLAVITGHEGTILVSKDTGKTWESHTAGTASNLFGVSVYADTAIGVGGQATIINSIDGGKGWGLSILGSPQQLFFYAVSLVNGKTGWAVGAYQATGSIILRTDLYGFTWSTQTTPTANTLFGVSFANLDTGIAVGANGTIVNTTDGGKVWTIQSSGISRTLNSVSFFNPLFGIAVGDSGTILRTVNGGFTAVGVQNDFNTLIPNSFYLEQNYPNPFNPTTTIQYSVLRESDITIKVYDILGKEITTLINERKSKGNYSVNFNGSNFSGGIYFYEMQAGRFISTKKFVLLK